MKNLLFLSLFLLATMPGFTQDCNLTEDRKDSYGNILRGAEWSFKDYTGSTVNLMLDRTKDRYTFVLNIDQPKENGVRFTLDGEVHPVIFNLSNGGSVNAWVSESRVYESDNSGSTIAFSEQYTIRNSQLRDFNQARVIAIVFKCSGRSIASGNAVNEIRFALNTTEGEALSNAFRCLQKEPEPIILKPAPKPRATAQTTNTNSGGGSSQDGLLRELIQVVGEGTSNIKESVQQSGTSQLEVNHMMMEKLEGLTQAIEKLNETKKEKEFVPRVFGFGVYFKTNYYFSEVFVPLNVDMDLLSAKFLTGTSINMTFNAGMKNKIGFRFEPYVDFLFNNTNQTTPGGNQKLKSSSQQIEGGLRLLLVIRRERVNIYTGLTGGYINLTAKSSSEAIGSVNYSRQKTERNGGSVGFVLGGEYLITPHFGIRLESGVLYYLLGNQTDNVTSNFGSGTNTTSTTTIISDGRFSTFGRLGGSFYF